MDTLAVYNVDEGEGTTLVDSSGNGYDATLTTSDESAFWNDAAPMVSQSIMEADQGVGVFTDLAGHAVPMSQTTIDTHMNINDQYFRKTCTGSNTEYFFYKQVLTGEDLLTVEVACCLM